MAKGKDTGSTFLAGILAKLSPEDRQKGEEVLAQLTSLGDGSVLGAIGDGVLAQGEFSRQMNELRERTTAVEAERTRLEEVAQQQQYTYEAQTAWFEEKQADLQELDRLRKAGGSGGGNGNGNGNPNPRPSDPQVPKGLTGEDLEAFRRDITSAFLGYDQDKNDLIRTHFAAFGTIPDFNQLMQHPKIRELGLKGVYQIVHKDQLDAHVKAEERKREDAIRADERGKIMAQQVSMPYPLAGEPPIEGGSPLDVLTGVQDQVVDKATAHYQEILRDRHAGRTV